MCKFDKNDDIFGVMATILEVLSWGHNHSNLDPKVLHESHRHFRIFAEAWYVDYALIVLRDATALG